MMRIHKEFTFEAAHFLPPVPAGDPNGRLHGHSFVVRVTVDGEPDPETGMIVHFETLGARLESLKDKLDHRLLNEVAGLEIPTLERMAAWIWRELKPALPGLAEDPRLASNLPRGLHLFRAFGQVTERTMKPADRFTKSPLAPSLSLKGEEVIPNPVECFTHPPHPVLLPEGRRDARIARGGCSGVLSPLGERDRVREDSANNSTESGTERQGHFTGLSKSTYLLALASFFSDVSTEMLYPVLPVFLTQTLPPAAASSA